MRMWIGFMRCRLSVQWRISVNTGRNLRRLFLISYISEARLRVVTYVLDELSDTARR
jgi:hypothetical protein